MSYWKCCIEEGLSDALIEATDEQINILTDWVEGAHENYGLATGEEFIPNPENAEIERLKAKVAQLERAHERQIDGVIKGVAKRRNVSTCDVDIDSDGLVTYR